MPTIGDQIQLPEAFTADFTVVRALLKKGRTYEQAAELTTEPGRLRTTLDVPAQPPKAAYGTPYAPAQPAAKKKAARQAKP